MIAALHYQNINHHPERINNLKSYIDNYNWDGIDFPTDRKGWGIFERNNPHIALNILSAYPLEQKRKIIRKS